MTEIIIGSNKNQNPEGNKLEAVIARIVMSAGVPPDEIDRCLEWAFGKDPLLIPIYPGWVDRWHKLHPKAFRIERKDKFVELLYVVAFSYCVERKKMAMRGGK